MNKAAQWRTLRDYLCTRNKGKEVLSEARVAKELLVSKAVVSVLLGSEELKSCHVDDVAEYIIKKDSEDGK